MNDLDLSREIPSIVSGAGFSINCIQAGQSTIAPPPLMHVAVI